MTKTIMEKIDSGEHQEIRDIQADYQDVTMTASNNPSFLPRGTALESRLHHSDEFSWIKKNYGKYYRPGESEVVNV